MKLHFIEDTVDALLPVCKNDRDIKLMKHYLNYFMAFLTGFAASEEGSKQIVKANQAFELAFFLLDTVNIPTYQETEQVDEP